MKKLIFLLAILSLACGQTVQATSVNTDTTIDTSAVKLSVSAEPADTPIIGCYGRVRAWVSSIYIRGCPSTDCRAFHIHLKGNERLQIIESAEVGKQTWVHHQYGGVNGGWSIASDSQKVYIDWSCK